MSRVTDLWHGNHRAAPHFLVLNHEIMMQVIQPSYKKETYYLPQKYFQFFHDTTNQPGSVNYRWATALHLPFLLYQILFLVFPIYRLSNYEMPRRFCRSEPFVLF